MGTVLIVLRLFTLALGGYLALAGYLYAIQRELLYHPDTGMAAPGEHGLPLREVNLTASDGVRLVAWYASPSGDRPLIAFFHGNAGDLDYRRDKFRAFLAAGYGLMAVSYRGFGDSEGSLSEQGLYRDARAAIDYVRRQGIAPARMVLYGESLGSGVASRMATEMRAGAVVLEGAYTSVAARGQEIYWFLPVGLLLKDRFENLGHLDAIAEPLLILHGEQDRVVPIHHGRALYQAADEPKRLVSFPEKGHDDLEPESIVQAVTEFLEATG